jgi:putative FmdB family regulatory protein
MPIYEYVCSNCGHELEALQKMSDDRLVFCPACGESSLKRKISASGFRLKGTGWYETDFKNSGKKKPESKTESSGESSGGKSSDSGGAGTGGDGPKSGDGGSKAA